MREGDYYEGAWADGVRSGTGMQQCVDGSNYVGEYRCAATNGCRRSLLPV